MPAIPKDLAPGPTSLPLSRFLCQSLLGVPPVHFTLACPRRLFSSLTALLVPCLSQRAPVTPASYLSLLLVSRNQLCAHSAFQWCDSRHSVRAYSEHQHCEVNVTPEVAQAGTEEAGLGTRPCGFCARPLDHLAYHLPAQGHLSPGAGGLSPGDWDSLPQLHCLWVFLSNTLLSGRPPRDS